eukprot:TRINITY_DN842_c1_g2_i1.p1 TRINITY_DN842_c1_g2~~TRINITY_DN842_c1_g2_i1.p1  ORF type:complete len:1538 (+),score=208.42 TRINITY_DN842_c1_g2_i1:363-4976(+)
MDPDMPISEEGHTLTHAAAAVGRLDVVQYAIQEWKASVTATDHNGNTALHSAAQNHITDVMNYLLTRMTRSEAIAENKHGGTALMYFIKSPEIEEFPELAKTVKRTLAKHHEANINTLLRILSEFIDDPTSQCDTTTLFQPQYYDRITEPDALGRKPYNFLQDYKPADNRVPSITRWVHWNLTPLKDPPFTEFDHEYKVKKLRQEFVACSERLKDVISEFKSNLFGKFVKAKIYDWILSLIACDSQLAFEGAMTICLYTSPTFYSKSHLREAMVSAGVTQSLEECDQHRHASKCQVLQLFIYKMAIALDALPKVHRYGYRGEEFATASKLDPGSLILYHNFVSASTEPFIAKQFAGRGVILCLVASSAPFIRPFSVIQQEDEFLFRPNTRFRIQWKLSTSLLRMLNCDFDVAVVYEINPQLRSLGQSKWTGIQQILSTIRNVTCSVSGLVFGNFSKDYIEGRLDTENQSSVGLYELLKHWVTSTNSTPIAIEGLPGGGKTSAGMAAVNFLATYKIEVKDKVDHLGWGSPFGFFTVHPAQSVPEITDNRDMFPIFIPLPKIKNLFARGAIDNYILNVYLAIGDLVTADEDVELVVRWLQKTYKIIVILDSLDETLGLSGVSRKSLNFLSLNPFLAKCRVLLTTRSSFLEKNRVKPSDFLGTGTDSFCLRPFSSEEKDRYIKNKFADRVRTWLIKNNLWNAVENPFILSMAVTAKGGLLKKLPPEVCFTTCDIYEEYFNLFSDNQGIRKFTDDVSFERVMEVAEELACTMTRLGVYEAPIAVFYPTSSTSHVDPNAKDTLSVHSLLEYLPLRIEDFNDPNSSISFRHNTFAEYLVARALFSRPVELLTTFFSETSIFSSTASGHGILDMYRQILKCDPTRFSNLEADLVALVIKSRSGSREDIIIASNALSLLCAAGRTLSGCDLSGIQVENTDLSRCCLSGVNFQDSSFRKCDFYGTQFHKCDLRRVDFSDSDFLLAAPPLKGHTDYILAVAYSKCGRFLASGSCDESIKIWSTEGQLLHHLSSHSGLITGLCFSNCGSFLASSSKDSSVIVWDVEASFSPIVTLKGHSDRVNCVAYSRCSSFIASGSKDNTICVWCVKSATLLLRLKKHTLPVTSVQFSATSDHLISTSKDFTAIIWKVSPNTAGVVNLVEGIENPPVLASKLHKLKGHKGVVSCSAFSKCGDYVFTGSHDMTLRKWDLQTGKPLREFRGGGNMSRITCLACSPSGENLISGGMDSLIRLWDASTGREASHFESTTERGAVTSIAYSSCGKYIASGSSNKNVSIWNSRCGTLRRLESHYNGACTAIFSSDGNSIISGGRDGTVRIWTTSTGKETFTFSSKSSSEMTAIATSASGDKFAAGGGNLVYLWKAGENDPTRTFGGHSGSVLSIAFSPSGHYLVTSDGSGLIAVWDTNGGVFLCNSTSSQCKPHRHHYSVNSVAFSTCGTYIKSSDIEGNVRHWCFYRHQLHPERALPPNTEFMKKSRVSGNQELQIRAGDIRIFSDGYIRLCIGSMDKNIAEDCDCEGITPPHLKNILSVS